MYNSINTKTAKATTTNTPNNEAAAASAEAAAEAAAEAEGDSNANNLPFMDLQTFTMGIYGAAVGCMQSYYNEQQGIVAPTLSHPDVGYAPNSNFFDPDNFMTISAMLYSGTTVEM